MATYWHSGHSFYTPFYLRALYELKLPSITSPASCLTTADNFIGLLLYTCEYHVYMRIPRALQLMVLRCEEDTCKRTIFITHLHKLISVLQQIFHDVKEDSACYNIRA